MRRLQAGAGHLGAEGWGKSVYGGVKSPKLAALVPVDAAPSFAVFNAFVLVPSSALPVAVRGVESAPAARRFEAESPRKAAMGNVAPTMDVRDCAEQVVKGRFYSGASRWSSQ